LLIGGFVGSKPQQSLPIYAHIMLARPRTLQTGFIAPCLPTNTHTLPSGGLWLHEIKHDGFRIIARKDGKWVRLYSRPGNDFTRRFPLIVEALIRLRSRSCIIDGEAVASHVDGLHGSNRRHSCRFAPPQELTRGLGVGTPGVGVADFGSEKF
jgi:hypothetical protein